MGHSRQRGRAQMPIAQAGGGANGNQAASIKAILHQAQGLSPTRRVNARDNAVLDHHQSAALRRGGCGSRLRPSRTDEARRDYRRLALRCHNHHRRRWLAPADRKRARRSPLSGPQDCGDRKQACSRSRRRMISRSVANTGRGRGPKKVNH